MLKTKRLQRHKSIRRGMNGNDLRPRLTIFRSSQHIYAQIIDDTKHQTLLSESDLKSKAGSKTERARLSRGKYCQASHSQKDYSDCI